MLVSAKRSRTPAAALDPITKLADIARNLWWSWTPEAIGLFTDVCGAGFVDRGRNPVVALRNLSRAGKRRIADDAEPARRTAAVHAAMRRYLRARTWFADKYGRSVPGVVAYFCMEYALHESLPLYAGGLGVLAGDHLKSASDLGLPLVAVGIYWKKGYTRQRISRSGAQTDLFATLSPSDAPCEEVRTSSGPPLRLRIRMDTDRVVARAWRVQVGRVPLFLLDTDLPANGPAVRRLTHVLYSGDRDMRIRQEILLGIGGWHLLRALNVPVRACHLNEGHAAFVSLERIAERIRKTGESFNRAVRHIAGTTVFTTHTPVPAGNEEFDPALVDRYFKAMPPRLRMSREDFHDLARIRQGDAGQPFGMTPLALRTSRFANAVAELHGHTARQMWKHLYPGRKLGDVPIGHVTNGIHLRTWLHPQMGDLYERTLGPGWELRQDSVPLWKRCGGIADGELWALRVRLKNQLIEFCRGRLRGQWRRWGIPGLRPAGVDKVLDEKALTIGFARRFATYKRATLIFSDPARLERILNNRSMPVQIIFAGKAHPADRPGKTIIEQLVSFSQQPRFRRRVVFLEDYNMDVARRMVAGVDVWLNNPCRPQEASGTSGMKPALHGGLNLSILDGWWPEGFNRRNGWAIGGGRNHDGSRAADHREALELYQTLEERVVPLFYQRNSEGLPAAWIAWMKTAMATICPYFNTHRQVKQYLTRYYLPAMRHC